MGNSTEPQKSDEQIKEEMHARWSNNTFPQPGQGQQAQGQEPHAQPHHHHQVQPQRIEDSRQNPVSTHPQQIPPVKAGEEQPSTIPKPQPQSQPQPSQPEQKKPIEPTPSPKQPEPEVIKEEKKLQVEKPIEEQPKPIINKEHAVIKKVFKICLDEEEQSKFSYLELYGAQLLSENKEMVFEIDSLDEIMLSIIANTDYKDDFLNYLLGCYDRAYKMIEIKFKETLDDQFKTILTVIATTISQLIASPSNYNISLPKESIKNSLTKYYADTEKDEVLSLCDYIVAGASSDDSTLTAVFFYIFNIIHFENAQGQSFFKYDNLSKNTHFLIELFGRNKVLSRVYVKEANYIPINVNGALLSKVSFLGPMLSLVPFEEDFNAIRGKFKPQMTELNSQVRANGSTLTTQQTLCCELIEALMENDAKAVLNYFGQVVALNVNKAKMYANKVNTSSNGFVLNCSLVCIELFFNECKRRVKAEYHSDRVTFYLQIAKLIEYDYCLSSSNSPFNSSDFINLPEAKACIAEQGEEVSAKDFSSVTRLFLYAHAFINYYMQQLDKDYTQVIEKLNACGNVNHPNFKDAYCLYCAYDVYIKSPDVVHKLLCFNELTYIFLFSLNNEKYSLQADTNSVSYESFYADFFDYIDASNVTALSILPDFVVKNVVFSSVFLRKYSADLFFKDAKLIKSLIYFSILYSSNVSLLHNPHLRSEVFDILTYTFIVNEKEKGVGHIKQINAQILQDAFVKSNLIVSLVRVFVDAERVGTSNQFYEKFAIRNKVLSLVENIFKRHEEIFKERIVAFSKDNDVTQMLNLLMNDVTYLVDEIIQRLSEIKLYEDLVANKEVYDQLDAERKEIELNKFNENDRLAKAEVSTLNLSLSYMVIMCSCLQKYFLNVRLAERLSNLLNYVLDEFTAKAAKLKIKNKQAYSFNPASIFSSLIQMYVAFKDFKDFHDYVVSDLRSYKYDNFLTAIVIKNTKMKIKLDFATGEDFEEFVNVSLKEAEERVKKNQIDYSDAPEEFIDQITSELMEDPVILPTSKQIVDRISIETHLLSDPIDPFNRMPLTKDMLIPDEALRERIKAYKEEKKKQKAEEIKQMSKEKQIEPLK